MQEDLNTLTRRRRFLTGVGVVATGATLASAAQAASQQSNQQQSTSGFEPARHDLDKWMDDKPSQHRAFIDSSTGGGAAAALSYASNILTGHTEDYAGNDDDYSMIVCFRHMSTPLGYNDVIWQKYGEGLSRFTGFSAPGSDQPLSVNPLNMNQAAFGNRGVTIDQLAARGVRFAICRRATQAVSGMLARSSGTSAADIFQELTANSVANSRFVSAGVIAATRSQEYGYSLLYANG